jgi:hypothetical protein
MKISKKTLLTIVIAFLLILLYQSYVKYTKQIKLYQQANDLSILLHKKLLIIGDPLESSTNYMFGHYGYGDICIDMNIDDSTRATESSTIIKDKLENVLHTFGSNSVVIFESEVLEYVDSDKIDNVISEMNRISNGDIFSVHQLKPNSLFTYCKTKGYALFNRIINKPHYSHKRLFKQCPPISPYQYV